MLIEWEDTIAVGGTLDCLRVWKSELATSVHTLRFHFDLKLLPFPPLME